MIQPPCGVPVKLSISKWLSWGGQLWKMGNAMQSSSSPSRESSYPASCPSEDLPAERWPPVINMNERAVIAQTVLLEAEGESFEGKLAVAFVIANRMKARNQSAYKVCWDPWQFSCWQISLDKLASRFANASPQHTGDCWIAVELATSGMRRDPTNGAQFYLNVELTKQQRGDGQLPNWVEKMQHTVKIGQHDFYKEV